MNMSMDMGFGAHSGISSIKIVQLGSHTNGQIAFYDQ